MMCDARCHKCRKKVGWAGEPKDQPRCPHCGAWPDVNALQNDQRVVDEFRAMLKRPQCKRCAGRGSVTKSVGEGQIKTFICRDCNGEGRQKAAHA